MFFKGTECCALECELNKAEAVGEDRHCIWACVMGYDATLNGLLVSRGGKVEKKHFPSVLSPCEAQGQVRPGQQLHHCPPTPARVSWGFGKLLPPDHPRTHDPNKAESSKGLVILGVLHHKMSFACMLLNVHHTKLEHPWLGSCTSPA